jgi:transcriptional regulator with XRE-family HTH domain
MTFDDILMNYRTRKGLTSWEALAEDLGITENGLRHIRRGRGALKEQTLRRIMEATGMEAPEIVAVWESENAEDPEVRASWRRWAASLAAGVMLAVGWGGNSQVVDSNSQAIEASAPVYYVKSRNQECVYDFKASIISILRFSAPRG